MVEIDDDVCGVSAVVDEVNKVVDIVVEVVDFGPDDEPIDADVTVEGVEVVLFVARRSTINCVLFYFTCNTSLLHC